MREDEPIFTSLKLAKKGGKEKKVLFIKAHRLLPQESMNTPNKQYTQHQHFVLKAELTFKKLFKIRLPQNFWHLLLFLLLPTAQTLQATFSKGY